MRSSANSRLKLKNMTGLIIRDRPKVLNSDNFDTALKYPPCYSPNLFYFNRGSCGLKLLLESINYSRNRKVTVAMQAYNCESVAEAALQAGCTIVLIDINLDDFSISFNELQSIDRKVDALLLTHYQGIPNKQYIEIADYCNRNDIILIDDLAQTKSSSISGVKIGTLSQASLFSYGFDKPITSLEGGAIFISNKIDPSISKNFENRFQNLQIEREKKAILDIRILRLLLKYTTPERYVSQVNKTRIIRLLLYLGLKDETVILLIQKKAIFTFLHYSTKLLELLFYGKNLTPKKLHHSKIPLICYQEKIFVCNHERIKNLIELLSDTSGMKIKSPKYSSKICWNKLALLDPDSKLIDLLSGLSIEVGNFNWPKSIDQIYNFNKKVQQVGELNNTKTALRSMINIPAWIDISDRIKKLKTSN